MTYAADKRAKYLKQGRESNLVVSVMGRMRSFRTMATTTAGIPGIKVTKINVGLELGLEVGWDGIWDWEGYELRDLHCMFMGTPARPPKGAIRL